MAQIEEEELTRLKEASKSLRESRSTIADIEISMHRLESKKKAILFNAEQAAEQLHNIQEELQQKYGDILIDLTTGEIKDKDGNS
jgi:2'-5' RNA ligase